MNFPFFIVKKIASNTHHSFARFILKIAVAAVALSMMVMIISTALISGFQQTISNKVFGFWAHIIITPYKAYDSLDKYPISKNNDLYSHPEHYAGVEHIQAIALKGGILHAKEDFDGIVLKGIGKDFKKDNFTKNLVEGQLFDITEEKNNKGIVISRATAKRLNLHVGDKIMLSFFEDNAKVRKRNFEISGIYDSGIEEFDKQYAWVDIAVIQNLNGWNEDEVGGFEIFMNNKNLFEPKIKTYWKKIMASFKPKEEKQGYLADPIDKMGDDIFYQIDSDLYAQTIKEFKPEIFNWLQLQNTNEMVILFIMLLVAAVNIITSLLILILERTRMVGILKALGTSNGQLVKIFIWNGVFIIGLGLLIGNVLGIGLCLLQDAFHLIKLPEESYYVSYAPVKLEWTWLLFLNVFTLLIGTLFLFIPTLLVKKIEAIKAIRFN